MSGDNLWQHKAVEIDLTEAMYELTLGELMAGRWTGVQDIKENKRIPGVLSLTNMRILWHAMASPRINLSIGLDCIVNISDNCIRSKVEGVMEMVKLLVHCQQERREFIFKCASTTSKCIASALNSVQKSFKNTKGYREFSLAIKMPDGFKVLPKEQICRKLTGVCNLCEDQGYIGELVITNYRVVWYSLNNINHNVSIPYLSMAGANVDDSKFGQALTFRTNQSSKNYRYGFRMDPPSLLIEVHKEVNKLLSTYRHKPDFAVDVTNTNIETNKQEDEKVDCKEDNCEIDARYDGRDVFSLLYKANGEDDGDVEYNDDLGLMMEKLPPGVKVADLCRVLA